MTKPPRAGAGAGFGFGRSVSANQRGGFLLSGRAAAADDVSEPDDDFAERGGCKARERRRHHRLAEHPDDPAAHDSGITEGVAEPAVHTVASATLEDGRKSSLDPVSTVVSARRGAFGCERQGSASRPQGGSCR